jgi:hypothetical protein
MLSADPNQLPNQLPSCARWRSRSAPSHWGRWRSARWRSAGYAIGRVTIKKARFETLEVDELTVRRLRVLEKESPEQ